MAVARGGRGLPPPPESFLPPDANFQNLLRYWINKADEMLFTLTCKLIMAFSDKQSFPEWSLISDQLLVSIFIVFLVHNDRKQYTVYSILYSTVYCTVYCTVLYTVQYTLKRIACIKHTRKIRKRALNR